MSKSLPVGDLRMIPINKIDILNTRERNTKIFEDIIQNIRALGLKKPITVTPRAGKDGEERFLLVCGEGRMKAFISLGEANIPALVVSVSDEDAFIMSLAENIARRQYRPLELLSNIEALRNQGYDKKAIAAKTGLTPEWVNGILVLLERGEERLLVAVERGKIPLTAALAIVGGGDDDKAVQKALQDAYESGKLRGKQLFEAKKVIECRHSLGRTLERGMSRKRSDVTTSSLVRTYQKEVERQRMMVKKAEMTQHRLMFVVGALRQLLSNENFTNLLRAEGLDTLPTYLAERVWSAGS
ncbi:plasmid partitioning protein RepB C-terminal domain-containing protein [Undibacterium sp. TS12]|uniref:plasmid partitioning protein RepB C-terminal domain-containing protein n=1 Tax=Undibacterium sp. TS12 TaxID=2908202 RepID=UPI001F4CFAAE|nr:plasmid partitioning protein RepB C-terminal domain-containing protein [Undibacterium sp. TS12]MCH8618156.1 ParB/RepB/Spo0J family partition protein [Undibacterium sp. TS12]